MRKLLLLLSFIVVASTTFSQQRFFSGQISTPRISARVGLINLSFIGTTAKVATADDGNSLPYPFDVGFASASGGLTKSSTVGGRFGAGSAYKFFTDKTQVDPDLGCRAELNMLSDPAGTTGQGYQNFERWIGFSAYIPSSWISETNTNIYHILHQWHDNCFSYSATENELKSAFEFGIWKGKWSFVNRSNLSFTGGITTEVLPVAGRLNLSDPDVTRDVWHDIVIHLKFKDGAASNPTATQAVVEIWIDGTKCANYSNIAMGYHHTQPPFFKIGNYSFMWNTENYGDYNGAEVQPTKTHWVDNIRIGNSSSNYYSVFPGNY